MNKTYPIVHVGPLRTSFDIDMTYKSDKIKSLPTFQAPECLLPLVIQLQNEVEQIETTLAAQKSLALSLESSEGHHRSIVDHIAGMWMVNLRLNCVGMIAV